MDSSSALWDRVSAVPAGNTPTSHAVLLACDVALLVCLVPGLWRWARVLVTLVHELGHAGIGIVVGRRFTGFVVRGDMSGHAVTSGRPTGVGRVVTTWAGYPAPAVVGALLVWIAGAGYAAAGLAVLLVILLVVLVRVRSAGTLLTMLGALAVVGAAWWWRDDTVQAQLLLGLGVLLVVGAWRHLGTVAAPGGLAGVAMAGGRRVRRADVDSDPAVLRQLTGIPSVVWTASFALVLAAASWGAVLALHEAL